MRKRIVCLVLAALILFGSVYVGAEPTDTEQPDVTTESTGTTEPSVPEESTEATEPSQEATEPTEATEPSEPEEDPLPTTSDACVQFIKAYEGFSKYPYWDYQQYTVGYGSTCPDDKLNQYRTYGITEEEAEELLRNHLVAIEAEIIAFDSKYSLALTQNQFDALVSFSYNCGTAWLYKSGTFRTAVIEKQDGNDFIRSLSLWCNAGGEILPALVKRRLAESNMYLNGIYDATPPENYAYVLFDANGGTASPRIQAYDTALTDIIRTEPTWDGHIFDGWFTDKTGTEKVTVLDEKVKNIKLYAHWTAIEVEEEPAPSVVTVTVTNNKVNLRQGPGTDFSIVGMANTGDVYQITEVATGSGYTWGKYDGGWICLKYTNYDKVIAGEIEPPVTEPPVTEPPVTEPPVTEPPVTEPPVTEPPVTEPPVTEPPVTEPPVTEPPVTEPETPAKLTGTVKVSSSLNIRSGAGTGYSTVGSIKNGTKVEILEQKMVGSVNWGRISKGWISMQYVVLDSNDKEDEPEVTPPVQTPDEQPASSWKGTVISVSSLRIRSGAGTSYSVVGTLYSGDKVTVTEMKTVGNTIWGKISKGWVSMDYIRLDEQAQPPATQTGTINTDTLRVRSGPGTSFAIAGYLYKGDQVEILERRTVDGTIWGRTEKGWISLSYVDFKSDSTNSGTSTQPSKPTTVVKTVNTSCLRVRKSASTGAEVVGYLYAGEKVTILETKTVGGVTWGRVAKGWISLEYTK